MSRPYRLPSATLVWSLAVILSAVLVGGEAQAQDAGAASPATAPASTADAPSKPKAKPRPKKPAVVSAKPHETIAARVSHICVLDRGLVDQRATINVASNKRLVELRNAIQAELDRDNRILGDRLKAVDLQLKLHPQDPAFQQQRRAVEADVQRLTARANLYSRQMEATRLAVIKQLQSETMPLVEGVARAKMCAIVLSRETTVAIGEAIDISDPVVEAMDAKLSFTPFSLATNLAN